MKMRDCTKLAFPYLRPAGLPGARKACLGLADASFRRILSASSAAQFAIP
jgi:hypothetical protein